MNEEAQKKEPQKESLTEAELRYWAGMGLVGEADGPDCDRARLGATLILQAAEMGHAEAKRTYAHILIAGFAVPRDIEKGLAYLRDAVADGSEEAEMDLARQLYQEPMPSDAEILWEGATVLWRDRADYAAASRLMKRAAKMNHIPAMRDYAQMIREGVGCEKDPTLAAEIEWQADELSKGKEGGMK